MVTRLANSSREGLFDSGMDGVCAESALPEKARLRVRSMSGLTMTPLGSMPLPPPTPATRTRVPLSLIRCAEVCSEPELLPGNIMCYRTMTDRAAKLLWSSRPSTFLLVKKWKDSGVTAYVLPLVKWLLAKKGVRVYVSSDDNIPEGAHLYTPANEQEIDVVITVGGDGTVLHMSSLFQSACPPVLSIAFGSLGFLTSIEPGEARPALEALLNGDSEPVEFTPRARLRASIYRSGSLEPESSQLGLNELILERGPSPYMTALDTYLDDVYLTVVQADGILVATPTGSTAYSLSAGGSIMFPTVPALAFTPICPHSLSFRPIILPDSSTLTLTVPATARASAWASIDGRSRVELRAGDKVCVCMAEYPIPLITQQSTHKDFLFALTSKLNWNLRERQLEFEPTIFGVISPAKADPPTSQASPSTGFVASPAPAGSTSAK